MALVHSAKSNIKRLAQAGLIAKGVVYCVLGLLVVMAAFELGGQSAESDKNGVLGTLADQPGGKIILGALAFGLLCYTIWRLVQAFLDHEDKGSDLKGLAVRGRYLFSGLVYGFLAFQAAKILFVGKPGSAGADAQEGLVAELLDKPLGQWLVGVLAASLVAVGIYQIYYGLSEKYRKHADQIRNAAHSKALLNAGKVGYISRGIVWLLIAWSFIMAAIHSNSSEAGGTSEAFGYLETAPYGPFLLAAVALGFICYGVFNFIRARFDTLD